jgi:hypothetical protein
LSQCSGTPVLPRGPQASTSSEQSDSTSEGRVTAAAYHSESSEWPVEAVTRRITVSPISAEPSGSRTF